MRRIFLLSSFNFLQNMCPTGAYILLTPQPGGLFRNKLPLLFALIDPSLFPAYVEIDT